MNSYAGEIKLELCDKAYLLKVNIGFLAEFKSETGVSFNCFAAKALSAWESSKEKDFFERASILAEAVDAELAAWAFYLAAKRGDKCVTFDEIQDAVIREGVYQRVSNDVFYRSYPVAFVELAIFALINIYEEDKKKATSSKPLSENKKK